MSKLNPQARAALQSARAKNRKAVIILGNAAAEHNITVPKHIVTKMTALNDWYDGLLATAKAKPEADDAETSEAEAATA